MDLKADREMDGRVAAAMGWTRIQHWMQHDVLCGTAPGKYWDVSPRIVPRFTTDPAMVVPMMEWISALGSPILILLAYHPEWRERQWSVAVRTTPTITSRENTANLAVAGALLAVAERKAGE